MAMKNEFKVTILEDGMVKIETGGFDAVVHATAEKALSTMVNEMGGDATKIKHGHHHHHEVEHSHDHEEN